MLPVGSAPGSLLKNDREGQRACPVGSLSGERVCPVGSLSGQHQPLALPRGAAVRVFKFVVIGGCSWACFDRRFGGPLGVPPLYAQRPARSLAAARGRLLSSLDEAPGYVRCERKRA